MYTILRALSIKSKYFLFACLLILAFILPSTPEAGRASPSMAEGDSVTLVWSSADVYAYDIAWGDVDGDGDLDLAAITDRQIVARLYLNDNGHLTEDPVWHASASGWTAADLASLAWGDVNSDGKLDLAICYEPSDETSYIEVYYNTGGKLANSPGWTSNATGKCGDLAWGDYDGDARPDLAAGIFNGGIYLYHNINGSLTKSPVWTSGGSQWTRLAWADFDLDGDLDIAVNFDVYYSGSKTQIYRNTGGVFSLFWQSVEINNGSGLDWGDYDGDGKPDLAVTNYNNSTPTRVYRNNGFLSSSSAAWSSSDTTTKIAPTWADYDGDGDLDLIVSESGSHLNVYRNDNGTLTASPAWTPGLSTDNVTAIAWGDYDGDNKPDIAIANSNGPQRVYRNNSGSLLTSPSWVSGQNDISFSTAWGDYDKNGYLDLAVGNSGSPNRIYGNFNGVLSTNPVWSAPASANTRSLAWGDVDGDGDLDLAVGNSGQANQLYKNINGSLTSVWNPVLADYTQSVAWGDYDQDGDLDLAVGNGYQGFYSGSGQPNRIYRNDNGVLTTSPVWSSSESDITLSVAWGDYDNDGDLDLAVGNWRQPNRIYRNDNGILTSNAVWSSADSRETFSIAWGDYDGDGFLDLATGNRISPLQLYHNDNGVLNSNRAWVANESIETYDTAWGDVDGDGDQDLALGAYAVNNAQLHRNDNGQLTPETIWSSTIVPFKRTHGIAWGDADNDGDLDLAVANGGGYSSEYNQNDPEWLFLNNRNKEITNTPIPTIYVVQPGLNANFYADPHIWNQPIIPITYTLTSPQSNPAAFIRAWYSVDGGGQWRPAIAAADTITTSLSASPVGDLHTYNWDVYASGLFGQSDNVVFRIQAVPAVVNHTNSIPGPYIYAQHASSTFPFRVRGTQVRVIQDGQPVYGAQVYRLPMGQNGAAALISDSSGKPFITDKQGFLSGRGALNPGDQLVALRPISATDTYTLYLSSASPIEAGLDKYQVSAGGVQTLTVSSSNSLVLFNLDVSLQWDARYNPNYLAQLQSDFQRTSQLLYDWSNGQAALGRTRIYHNRQNWDNAHIRIYASEKQRPMALQGGIVSNVISDPQISSITYSPGQVHMGAVWNRYGDAGTSLGDDWPRALAHELGHYALFLNDNYLGLDDQGRLIPVDNCPSAMTDPYREDYPYDEFHPTAGWLSECASTLSNQSTGRSDWQTIEQFYPALNSNTLLTGPAALPLAVTWLQWFEPPTPSLALVDPTFYLVENGARVEPGSSTRAFLFQHGWAIDLGKPNRDRVVARGAEPGDEICVYELKEQQIGCENVSAGDEFIEMAPFPTWQPEIIVTPVSTTTIQVDVLQAGTGLSMRGAFYPLDGPKSSEKVLTETNNSYSATLNLADPAFEGYIRIWVDEPAPRREMITDFALGGNPARMRGSGARMRGSGARMRGSGAPVMSADGQVILYVDDTQLAADEFYTLQAATAQPEPLPWGTLVGQAYQLTASKPDMDLTRATISFSYLGNEVSPGEEDWLRIYYRAPLSTTWSIQPTNLDTYYNTASSTTRGAGIYALMSSLEIPLPGIGWNLIAYPVNATRPVPDSLQSINNYYSMVYGFDSTDLTDPWKLYSPYVPSYVNDLQVLEFGHGYWIYVTQPITMYLKGSSSTALTRSTSFVNPPATFYGLVQWEAGRTIISGVPVEAYIDNHLCGQGATKVYAGQLVYVVDVFASDSGAHQGCGEIGKMITFYINGQRMFQSAIWDNRYIWEHNISPLFQLFLPILNR